MAAPVSSLKQGAPSMGPMEVHFLLFWPQAFFLENVFCVEGEAPGEGTRLEALLGVGDGVGWGEAVLP